MEKVIYENESSKLIAIVDGGVVQLTQTLEGEIVGSISMYIEEAEELNGFINEKEE